MTHGIRPTTDRRRARPVAGRVPGVVLAVALLVLVPVACGDANGAKVEVIQERTPVTHEYVIPFGTGRRLASGESIQLVPRVLKVRVGDVIRIRNEDTFTSNVGIFHVGPGETVTMRFKSPGRLVGACDVHPSGEFIVDVREA